MKQKLVALFLIIAIVASALTAARLATTTTVAAANKQPTQLSLAVTSTTPHAGKTLTFSGVLQTATAAHTRLGKASIYLYVSKDKKNWAPIYAPSKTLTNANGAYAFSKSISAGTWYFRTYFYPGTTNYAGASSPTVYGTTIHVWEGYMGQPAFWLNYPKYHVALKQGGSEEVRYWVVAADGTNPCGAANYYIDNHVAGGSWVITKPQPQYWKGCPAGLPGGAGGLYLHPSDTAKLSLGWHTLKIDYLGQGNYAPSEFVAQFLVGKG